MATRSRNIRRQAQSVTPVGDIAYKGYLIRVNQILGLLWIERDGQRIAGASSVDDAKSTINLLVN